MRKEIIKCLSKYYQLCQRLIVNIYDKTRLEKDKNNIKNEGYRLLKLNLNIFLCLNSAK